MQYHNDHFHERLTAIVTSSKQEGTYLEHKRVNLFTHVVIGKLPVLFVALQQQIQECQSLFRSKVQIFSGSRILRRPLGSALLQRFLPIANDLYFSTTGIQRGREKKIKVQKPVGL